MKMTPLKSILAGAAALTLLGGGVASAQSWDHGRGHDRGYDRGYGYGYDRGDHRGWDRGEHRGWDRDNRGRREWRRGEYWRGGYGGYYVSDPYRYHLRPAPRGYRWIRDDRGDYILAAIATGLIIDVIANSSY